MVLNLFVENERYYADSHWFGWIGPRVAESDPNSIRLMEEVERIFQEANKVRECVDRHRRALTAKPFAWQFEDEQGDEEFMEKLLSWTLPRSSRLRYPRYGEAPIVFPNAIAEAVHYRLLGGYGYLRLWLPKRFEGAAAWRRVALHSPHPDMVEVEDDSDGVPLRITYRYQVGQEEYREVQEISDQGGTIFRTLDPTGSVVEESTLDLGGRFTVCKIQGNAVVTRAVKRAQNGINYALTLMIRNLQYGGFLRDIIFNGLPPGEYDEYGNFIHDPDGWQEGPGLKMEVQGLPIYDSEGNVSDYTNPSVSTRNPVDVSSFINSYKASCAAIYEAFGQGHILASDMQISGVSRQQLRQDFVLAATEDADELRTKGGDLYAAAYLLARGTGSDVSVVVEPRLSISELTPEELNSVISQYDANLRSQRSAMQQIGVDNPVAEMEEILDEQRRRMEVVEPSEGDLIGGDDDGGEDDDIE